MLDRFIRNVTPCGRTRREFLWEVGGGFAGLGLIDLLSRDGFFAKDACANDAANGGETGMHLLAPKAPHFGGRSIVCSCL